MRKRPPRVVLISPESIFAFEPVMKMVYLLSAIRRANLCHPSMFCISSRNSIGRLPYIS